MPWCKNKFLSSTHLPPTTFSTSPSWTSTSLSIWLTHLYDSPTSIYIKNHNSLPSSNHFTSTLTIIKTLTSSTTITTTPPSQTKIPTKLNKFRTRKKDPLPKALKLRIFVSTFAKKLSRSWKPEFTTRNWKKSLQSSGKHLKKWSKRSWK